MNLIRYIDLSSYSITDELAVDVEAVALNNKGLVSIAFDECIINDMVVHLSASISTLTVKRLSIMNCTDNDFEDGYIESLITNSNVICHLNLSFSAIQDCTKHRIVTAIRKQPTLQGLSLNYFTVNKALENEMESLFTELQYLELAGCKLTERFLIRIAEALSENNKLQHLNLSYNTFTPAAAAEIFNLLSKLSTLKSIEMAECSLNRVTCSNVSRTLIKLNLSGNPISDQHVGDVVNLIGNNCNLQHLNLSNCAFTSSGILAITKALRGITRLVYLNLNSNHVSDQLNCVFANVAALIANNKNIKSLHLPDCATGDIDLEILFEPMKGCFTARCSYTLYLDISNGKVSDSFIHNIRIVFANDSLCSTSSELIVSHSQCIQVCSVMVHYTMQNITIKCCISEDYISKLSQILYNNLFMSYLDIHESLFSNKDKFPNQVRYWRQMKLYGVVVTKYSIDHIVNVISANRNIEHSYYTIPKVSESECEINKFYKIFKDTRSSHCFVINYCGSGKFEDHVSPKYLNFSYSMLPKTYFLLLCEFINQLTTLVHINLSHNNISTKAAELIASSIKKNKFLQHLELASCSLHEKSMVLICDAVKHKDLLTLNMSHNCISDFVALKLADVISTLHCIDCLLLENCSLQEKEINVILAALAKKNTLKTLDLSCNKMTFTTLDLTAVVNGNIHLENLSLSDCKLRSMTINSKLPKLKLIDLKGNHFSEFFHFHVVNESAHLHTLVLSNYCGNQTPHFEILQMVKHSLKHLDLSYNVISTETAESVADVIHNNIDLEHLNLSNCKFYGDGLNAILEAAKKVNSLKYLNLAANTVDNEMASKVAALILNNLSLNYLSLSNCAIQETAFLEIAESLSSTKLITLEISFNVLASNFTAKLATIYAFGKYSQLQYLNVSNCVWHEYSLQLLLQSTEHVNNLRSINVSSCEMNGTDAELLAASISANYTLEQLILAKCVFQSAGLVSVLDTLKNLRTLNHLDLSYIIIDNEIMPSLVEVISFNQIEHLNLSHCSLGANCTVVLTAIVNSGTLQYLDLSYNDISDDEASCVASAISNNEYLHHINLTKNKFGRNSLEMILKSMTSISSLRHVNLDSYVIVGQFTGDLVAVAKSNPGLEAMVVLKENLTLSKVNSKKKFLAANFYIMYLTLITPHTAVTLLNHYNRKTHMYSRSQNNVNIVYCNYKETNGSYNVIAKRNSPQTLLIVGNIFKIFV